jgi:TIR domain-containing protein
MSSLAELPELVGFFSYSRDDDEAFKGTLSALREAIQRDLGAQLGRSKRTFRLWQDQAAISPGELWEKQIKEAIDQSHFFIPIVTPRSISSKYCKSEFEFFLAREKALGRNNLVFPILYIPVAALEDETKWRNNFVLSTIGERQYVDWRALRYLDIETSEVREQIGHFCQKIVEALNEPWTSPEERQRIEEDRRKAEEEQRQKQAEAEARQQSEVEEKARRLEAEKRRADEEEARKRVEANPQEGAKAERETKEGDEARQRAEERLRRLGASLQWLGQLPVIILIIGIVFASGLIVQAFYLFFVEHETETGFAFLLFAILCLALSFGLSRIAKQNPSA